MANQIKEFGEVAKGLARSPLGIIALFIVLVYAFASLVAFGGSFQPGERAPLIYFLVAFPVLVLVVFAWLVSTHSKDLFGPSDYRNEENYVKMQLSAVASLAVASTKDGKQADSNFKVEEIVEMVRHAAPPEQLIDGWRNHILWVDDRPNNNKYEGVRGCGSKIYSCAVDERGV